MLPFSQLTHYQQEPQNLEGHTPDQTQAYPDTMPGDFLLPQANQAYLHNLHYSSPTPNYTPQQPHLGYNYELTSQTTYSGVNQTLSASQPTIPQATLTYKQNEEIQMDRVSQIRKDLKIQTTTGKRYTCKVCNKELSSKRSLLCHEKIHPNVRPFSCLICGKGFLTITQLQNHGYTHLQDEPFECSECGKKFRHQRNLQAHKSLHEQGPRHQCPVCPREFRLKGQLSTHLYIHVDCKPYHCKCGKSFRRKWYLTSHLKTKNCSEHSEVTAEINPLK